MRDQDVYAVELTGIYFVTICYKCQSCCTRNPGNTGLKAFEEGEKSDH